MALIEWTSNQSIVITVISLANDQFLITSYIDLHQGSFYNTRDHNNCQICVYLVYTIGLIKWIISLHVLYIKSFYSRCDYALRKSHTFSNSYSYNTKDFHLFIVKFYGWKWYIQITEIDQIIITNLLIISVTFLRINITTGLLMGLHWFACLYTNCSYSWKKLRVCMFSWNYK